MRHYEIVFMVHPNKSEYVQDIIDVLNNVVKKLNGNVHRLEDWGLRHLAYQINKLHKAHYVLLNVEVPPKGIKEIENILLLNEIVIRSMIVRVETAVESSSIMAVQKSEYERKKDVEKKISVLEKTNDV